MLDSDALGPHSPPLHCSLASVARRRDNLSCACRARPSRALCPQLTEVVMWGSIVAIPAFVLEQLLSMDEDLRTLETFSAAPRVHARAESAAQGDEGAQSLLSADKHE